MFTVLRGVLDNSCLLLVCTLVLSSQPRSELASRSTSKLSASSCWLAGWQPRVATGRRPTTSISAVSGAQDVVHRYLLHFRRAFLNEIVPIFAADEGFELVKASPIDWAHFGTTRGRPLLHAFFSLIKPHSARGHHSICSSSLGRSQPALRLSAPRRWQVVVTRGSFSMM